MRVLLVDHDSEALETITRAIRGVLELDCVTSKGDALLLLRQNTYDVLIACERAIDGSGLDLLGRTTRTAVPLKRIFAAAPERLQLLGPRLAPFKVQRTINYPIDLEELWLAIAQVTSGPDDETDGTIERVVLDERGIPAAGSSPRAPIPPRPPAPLALVPPPPAPAIASSLGAARTATARLTQPTPEPPLRPPPPPRVPPQVARPVAPPKTTSDTGRMRAPVIPPPPMNPAEDFPSWTPEPPEDDFEQIAAQARLGVQQKAFDEVSRRKRQRIMVTGGIVLAVGGAIFFLVDKFYNPAAWARERAITEQVAKMAEQQKVTDDLTLIEIDIENSIMKNDLDKARAELAELVEKAPNHPRREFLQASIDRAAELAKLSPGTAKEPSTAQPAVLAASAERGGSARPRAVEREPEHIDRAPARAPDRVAATRPARELPATAPRTYGAPIGDSPRETLPLNAPINSAPITTMRRENSFAGRTVEATDSSVPRAPASASAPAPAASTSSIAPGAPNHSAGSAAVSMPPVAPPPAAVPAPVPAPAVDVVPAKLVKRVTPIAPSSNAAKASGYVILGFIIGTNGRVTDLQVIESEPQGVFDDAARDAVKKWVYEPRKENGIVVAQPAKAKLVFEPAR